MTGARSGHTPRAMHRSGTERAPAGERTPGRIAPTASGEPPSSTRGAPAGRSGETRRSRGRALTDAGAREVLLFGSVAARSAALYSDIDLVVVLDDLDYRRRRDAAHALEDLAAHALEDLAAHALEDLAADALEDLAADAPGLDDQVPGL